jgi:hypothetical protein
MTQWRKDQRVIARAEVAPSDVAAKVGHTDAASRKNQARLRRPFAMPLEAKFHVNIESVPVTYLTALQSRSGYALIPLSMIILFIIGNDG